MSTTQSRATVIGRLPRITAPAIVSPVARRALEQAQPLTVLRGTRGFGKTCTLVTWLRDYHDGVTVLYHPLDTTSNDPAGFWAGLGRALADAGLISMVGPAHRTDARAEVLAALGDLPHPLRLVLDNFHEAGLRSGSAAIDNDLIELIRNNEQFYLVAAGRTLRALETVGCLSVDACLVGPADLRLTALQVQDLAARTGQNLTADQAQQITSDLGGWPGAIRAGLHGITADGTVDENLVRGYIGAMISDLRSDDVRAFLLRTAVVGSFDIDLLRVITPVGQDGAATEDSAAILARLRTAGVLQEERTGDGVQYRHPAAIRRALLQVMRETAPELGRQVHRALLAAPGMQDSPAAAVLHAVRAEEWDTVLDLIERQWFSLLTESPQDLVAAVQQIPDRYGLRDPRVRMARKHLAAIIDRAPARPTWVVPESLLGRPENLSEGASATEQADHDSVVLLQWGVASLMSGHHAAATYAFSQARELGLHHGTKAAVLGAAGVALVHALVGEPDLARSSLADPALQEHVGGNEAVDPDDLAAITVQVTRALIAVDAGDADAADLVTEVVEPRNRADLWVAAEFARAHHAAFADDPEEVFREANKVRAALRHVARNTLAYAVLQSVLVELLLIARMVGVAAEAAENLGEDSIGWTARAKVHTARQDFHKAVHFARTALRDPQISRRSELEVRVILASALHALNDQNEARRAFRSAVQLSRATGQRRPFQLMHRYVFDLLAEDLPLAHGLWPGSTDQTVRGGTHDVADLPTLTMREAQVLRALERHAGPVGIGRSLDLSVNTVKTHLRSIYRKLGVASRNEALDAAGRGGIQPPREL